MPQEEIYGARDRAYSAWHRRLSTARFIGIEQAQLLSMIDLDAALYVEFDSGSKFPLALIETARDVGQMHKPATVTQNLARRANLPAYCVLYRHAREANPADARCFDIDQFRVRRLWPQPEWRWQTLTPYAWAQGLLDIRAYAARRMNALDFQAANDDRYFDEPPAVTVRSIG